MNINEFREGIFLVEQEDLLPLQSSSSVIKTSKFDELLKNIHVSELIDLERLTMKRLRVQVFNF